MLTFLQKRGIILGISLIEFNVSFCFALYAHTSIDGTPTKTNKNQQYAQTYFSRRYMHRPISNKDPIAVVNLISKKRTGWTFFLLLIWQCNKMFYRKVLNTSTKKKALNKCCSLICIICNKRRKWCDGLTWGLRWFLFLADGILAPLWRRGSGLEGADSEWLRESAASSKIHILHSHFSPGISRGSGSQNTAGG